MELILHVYVRLLWVENAAVDAVSSTAGQFQATFAYLCQSCSYWLILEASLGIIRNSGHHHYAPGFETVSLRM